jgi:hypothetical protein
VLLGPKGRGLGGDSGSKGRVDGVHCRGTIRVMFEICLYHRIDLLLSVPYLKVIPDADGELGGVYRGLSGSPTDLSIIGEIKGLHLRSILVV